MTWARRHKIAAVASVHTRFDTYLAYYHMQALEPLARGIMRRFYHRCEVVLAPAESTAAILRAQRMNRDIAIWARGIDRDQFNPERRDMAWRRDLGIADDEMVIAFLGRVVMEKGLDVFADAIHAFETFGFKHRVLVIGEGPARPWFEEQLPDAIFTRPADRCRSRSRARQRRRVLQSVDHRGVRQRHAGGDGLRPSGHRRRSDRGDQPGPRPG